MTQVLIRDFLKPPKERSASTRPQGKRVRHFMSKNWADVDQFTVVFDKGLRATISFMDEAFAKLLEDHNPDEVLNKIRFQDISEYNQLLFFKVLRNRLVHGTRPTRKTMSGTMDDLAKTYENILQSASLRESMIDRQSFIFEQFAEAVRQAYTAKRFTEVVRSSIVPPVIVFPKLAIPTIPPAIRHVFDGLNKERAIWQQMVNDATRPLRVTQTLIAGLMAWDGGIAHMTEWLEKGKVFKQNAVLATQLLRPYGVLTDFANKTTLFINAQQSDIPLNALEASLRIAEGQLASWTDLVCTVDIGKSALQVASPIDVALNLPSVQQQELLAIGDIGSEYDIASLVRRVPAACSAAIAQQVEALVVKCNQVAKTSGRDEIFKPTTRMLLSYLHLSWIVPDSEESFAIIIDSLFFIIYEGAGEDNLRFLAKHGGVLQEDECEFIWRLKHLRQLWRHDPDHGSAKDIRKKYGNVSEAFTFFGLGSHPIDPNHFRILHRNVLARAEEFLVMLLNKLTA